jgi:hypothetical protein
MLLKNKINKSFSYSTDNFLDGGGHYCTAYCTVSDIEKGRAGGWKGGRARKHCIL